MPRAGSTQVKDSRVATKTKTGKVGAVGCTTDSLGCSPHQKSCRKLLVDTCCIALTRHACMHAHKHMQKTGCDVAVHCSGWLTVDTTASFLYCHWKTWTSCCAGRNNSICFYCEASRYSIKLHCSCPVVDWSTLEAEPGYPNGTPCTADWCGVVLAGHCPAMHRAACTCCGLQWPHLQWCERLLQVGDVVKGHPIHGPTEHPPKQPGEQEASKGSFSWQQLSAIDLQAAQGPADELRGKK